MRASGETSGAEVEVLLIEDDADHAELVIRCLEDHPIANDIRHFTDGETALEYLLRYDREDWSRPQLILLDLRLPKIDGLEVLKKIRSFKELDTIPVVVLSTSRDSADVNTAYALHANSYLVKPLDFASFSSLLTHAGFYWLRWNHYPGRLEIGGP